VAHGAVLTPSDAATVRARAARLRLLLFDVDGVMTDGTIGLYPDGSESKAFSIRDGTGIVIAHQAGLMTGILSARASACTAQRASQLGMRIVLQGVRSKPDAYRQALADHDLRDEEVGYMGDDLLDLPVLARVGLSAAPCDAAEEVRARVAWVSRARGGHGAVRELVELVLRAQDRWDAVVRSYVPEDGS
jgi:3-deoxy-D-manno-octulosonate 8-phosphate phosphatase (KDO 8-P phosphatase)